MATIQAPVWRYQSIYINGPAACRYCLLGRIAPWSTLQSRQGGSLFIRRLCGPAHLHAQLAGQPEAWLVISSDGSTLMRAHTCQLSHISTIGMRARDGAALFGRLGEARA